MSRWYWRRVWVWDGQKWNVVRDYALESIFGSNCTLDGPSFCQLPPPYIFEQWWEWNPHPSTIGTAPGEWRFLRNEKNW